MSLQILTWILKVIVEKRLFSIFVIVMEGNGCYSCKCRYKIKSAVRDVAKVLGFDSDEIDSLISQFALKNIESVTSDFTGSFKRERNIYFS